MLKVFVMSCQYPPPHAYVFLPFGSMKPQAVQSLRSWVPPVNDSSKLQFSPSHFAQPGVTLNILNLSEFSQPWSTIIIMCFCWFRGCPFPSFSAWFPARSSPKSPRPSVSQVCTQHATLRDGASRPHVWPAVLDGRSSHFSRGLRHYFWNLPCYRNSWGCQLPSVQKPLIDNQSNSSGDFVIFCPEVGDLEPRGAMCRAGQVDAHRPSLWCADALLWRQGHRGISDHQKCPDRFIATCGRLEHVLFSITHRIHGAAIYGKIYHQYTPNVSIYTIHGSYG